MLNIIREKFSIQGLLEAQAARDPKGIAILAPERDSLTYGGLWLQISNAVRQLRGSGIERNQRVAIVLPNGPEMAVAFLSVAAVAATAPLNPSYRAAEFDFYLSDLNVAAVILQSDVDSPAREVAKARQIPIIELTPLREKSAGIFTFEGSSLSSDADRGFSQADDLALLLHTSGTTSKPKIVPLTQANIGHSAFNIATSLNLQTTDRCLNVMPLFHIHGLIAAVLSSLVSGGSVVCTPGFYAPNFFQWIERFHPSWYTAVPTMHQSILQRVSSNRKIIEENPLRFVRSSSSALPQKVMAELEKAFQVPVVEAYGMTEASHQISTNPLPPAIRKPGSVGIPAGVEVTVMEEKGNVLPHGKSGEIVIRGPNIMCAYESPSNANANAFHDGWFRTGDLGFIDSDGYLFINGRLKEIINRGGEKISPREIDEVLMEHPAVAQVVTFAVPHEKLGEEIAAAVVLGLNQVLTPRELQEFAASRLTHFKIPRHVVIVKEIPRGATGKLQRIGLAEKLGLAKIFEHPDVKADSTNGLTEVQQSLAKIWQEVLGISEIKLDDEFLRLGGDSVLATLIHSRIRKAFDVDLSFVVFLDSPTIRAMAKSIENAQRLPYGLSVIEKVPRVTPEGVE